MQSEVASGTSTMTRKKTATKAVAKKAKSPERKATVRPSSKAAGAKGPAAKATAKVAPKAAKPDATRKGSIAKKAMTPSAVLGKKAAKPAQGAAAPLPKIPPGPAKPALEPVAAVPPVARATAPPPAARAMPAAATLGKGAAQRIAAPATPKAVAERTALARQQAASKKPVNQRHGFKTNEWIVYPAHGVGRIVGIEEQEIAGISLELFVITFEKDKMTLRVPTGKSQSVGMRKLAEEPTLKKAMETLRGKARVKRTMWSRRAQEYEAKINSGDLISIAEVVRDLYRSESQPEQSYSERQLYEAALDRMARELAAVEKLDERGAVQRITEVLAKSAKGRRLTAEETEVKAA
jgi:CarD family transcriptional regulator, regulator of rRNA transcription